MSNLSYTNDLHYISEEQLQVLQTKADSLKQSDPIFSILKTLSDPTRTKIYVLLNDAQELSVSDIATILQMSQSSISHALSDMKKLNLVTCQRCGQIQCYSKSESTEVTQAILNIFQKHTQFPDN